MPQIMITLNHIKVHSPHMDRWVRILMSKPDTSCDELFPLSDISRNADFKDVLWIFRCLPNHLQLWCRYALWCAQQAVQLSDDPQVKNCLDIADKYLMGEVDIKTLREVIMKTAKAIDFTKADIEENIILSVVSAAASLDTDASEIIINEATLVKIAAESTARVLFWAQQIMPRDKVLAEQELLYKLRQIIDAGEWV